jgi:phosphate transport system protein
MKDHPLTHGGDDLTTGHTVSAYNRELARLRGLILEMGERVLEQTQGAIAALSGDDLGPAYRVLDREPQVDYLALDADEEVFRLIARRQPAAVDLRIALALARIAGEAERAADKAARIARNALAYHAEATDLPVAIDTALRAQSELVCSTLERSFAAVERFDVTLAIGVFEDEPALIAATRTMHQALVTPADAPLSPATLGPLFSTANGLEYLGRHAGAIAEQVIYVAEGKDVRFRNREILIEALRHRHS